MTTPPRTPRRPARLDRVTVHAVAAALLLVPALAACSSTAPDAAAQTPVTAPAPQTPGPTVHQDASTPTQAPAAKPAPRPAPRPARTPTRPVPHTSPAKAAPPVQPSYRKQAQKLQKALAQPGATTDPATLAAGAKRLCAALDAGQLTATEAAGALVMAGTSIEDAVAIVRNATATTCPQHRLAD